jgi:hypothetical protein
MAIGKPQAKKLYRTMQGRMVDIDKLRAANETVPAVGNMGVNARGDILGSGGRIIKSKNEVMKEYYQSPKGMAQDTAEKKTVLSKPKPQVINPTVPNIEQTERKTVSTFKPKTSKKTTTQPEKETKSGIDAALDGIE